MATNRSCTSALPLIWVIETLASSNEIDTTSLIDLVERTPEISDDLGRNARELVFLRVLEKFVQKISNANSAASVPGDKIEFDPSVCCEDELCRLLLEVLSERKIAGPDMSKWDVQSLTTEVRSCLPKCSLQQIKDAILDSTNHLSVLLKAKNRLEVGCHSRNEGHFNAVDLNGIKQSDEVRGVGAQYQLGLPNWNATLVSQHNADGLQENQPTRTLVPPKRTIDASISHEEHNETEPISENSSDPCTKASKKIKQDVISPRQNAVNDLELSQRDGVTIELSAEIPQYVVQKENLENEYPVGNLDGGSDERAASRRVRQSSDSDSHGALLPQRRSPGEKIQNVGCSSKACAELRTSSGSPQHVTHQDSCNHGTKDCLDCNGQDLFNSEPSKGAKRNIEQSHEAKIQNVECSSKACAELRTSSGSSQHVTHHDSFNHGTKDCPECNGQDLFNGEPSKGAKKNIEQSHEPELSSDSDGCHIEKTGLAAKKNDFFNSQCTQGQDSLPTDDGRELNLCVKCNQGGLLLVCSSDTCPLVVHESCLGDAPSFDNIGNFYCPFCAYCGAISEYLEAQKEASFTRKELVAFMGIVARQKSKKSSRKSHKKKKSPPRSDRSKQKQEEEALCPNGNSNKNSLNEINEAGNARVNRSSDNAKVTKIVSPQPDACARHDLEHGQSSVVEESPDEEDNTASRYYVRFRNAEKKFFFKFAVPILQFLK